MTLNELKLHDLRCFDAVASQGSFQAAALALNRSHPSVFAAVARLEHVLKLTLLDRSGYRASLTEAGALFHARARLMLRELEYLHGYADQLASGEETVLRVVLGDVCPRPSALRLLGRFFAGHNRTRLHLEYETINGPLQRLLEGQADLILHRADPSDPRLERVDLCTVEFVPVVAPGFLSTAPGLAITPERMRPYTQCVIRDTARQPSPDSYFLVEGSQRCSVPDHQMKKELILNGLAWGHLPAWLIAEELKDGRLLSIAGEHLPGRVEAVAAIRRRDQSHGPVAEALWQHLRAQPRSITGEF